MIKASDSVKLNELKQMLNDRVVEFVGKKVTVDGEFHRCIDKCVVDVLNNASLKDKLDYRIWSVKLKLEYLDGIVWDMDKVFTLNININRDNRYKSKTIGVLTDIKFELVDKDTSNLTLDEFISRKQIESKELLITQYEDAIQSLLNELECKTKSLNELKIELETLKEQCNN